MSVSKIRRVLIRNLITINTLQTPIRRIRLLLFALYPPPPNPLLFPLNLRNLTTLRLLLITGQVAPLKLYNGGEGVVAAVRFDLLFGGFSFEFL